MVPHLTRSKSAQNRWTLWIAIAIALMLASAPAWMKTITKVAPRPIPRPVLGGQVHGYVMALLRTTQGKSKIPSQVGLPDASVYLKRLPAGTVVPSSKTTTNAHGYFIIPRQTVGRYRICYSKAGFTPRCDDSIISIGRDTVVLTHFLLLSPKAPGAVVGRALLKDGSVAFRETYAFGTLVTTQVNLFDSASNKVWGPITANNYGVFVVPDPPGAGTYQLKGSCALGTGTRNFTASLGELNGANTYDLILDNRPPAILSLIARKGADAVRTANPGDTLLVSVAANDADGDSLHYQWGTNTPGFTSTDTDTVSWTLPNVSATNTIFVQVSDGKGGYDSRNLTIQSGAGGTLFTGNVIDRATRLPIAGADVTMRGDHTTTNAAGAFKLVVKEESRYVLNVEKPQYALLSRVYYSGATNLLLEMDRAHRQVIDTRQGGKIIDEGKRGTSSVSLPPNAIVDRGGVPVAGPVNVDIHSYDLQQRNPIPGDMSGINTDGKDVRLETYGAMHVQVTDPVGQELQLAPGASAEVTIAIDPTVLATAPPNIPLLVYDKKSGYWKQEGEFVRSGNHYTANVRHFSVFNADTVSTNTACIRMTVADTPPGADAGGVPRFAPTFPFTLHVDFTDSGGPRHNDFPVTDPINALLRLPPNINVTLNIVTAVGPGRTFTVNSGNAVPDAISYPPPFDYTACNGFDLNNLLPGHPVVLAVELPAHNVPYLGVPGTPPSDAESTEYYKTIGALDNVTGNPTAARGNFTAWKMTNGLSVDPNTPVAGEIEGIYFNNGDLQLGRDMHCKCSTTPCTTSSDAACYVTNYGASVFGGPQGQPDLAIHDAIHHAAPLATVAMEYRHLDTNKVKFFIYDAAGNLLLKVGLDSEGAKNLPHLCLACHGGSYAPHDAFNANFLPFDVFSFLYDQVEGKSLAAQQEDFRKLNSIIRGLRANPADAIGGLVDGMYPCGVNNPACAAVDTPFSPSGWSGNVALYQTITRPYCRGCHIAQPGIDWTAASQWTGIVSTLQFDVCSNHFMPHAEVPYKKFWLSQSPHAPQYMFGPAPGLGGAACPP
jgi:hypothetical protein